MLMFLLVFLTFLVFLMFLLVFLLFCFSKFFVFIFRLNLCQSSVLTYDSHRSSLMAAFWHKLWQLLIDGAKIQRFWRVGNTIPATRSEFSPTLCIGGIFLGQALWQNGRVADIVSCVRAVKIGQGQNRSKTKKKRVISAL